MLKPEKHRLQILYRLTQTLKQIVRTILPNSQIEAAQVDRMVAKVDVRLAKAHDINSEVKWVWHEACRYCKHGDPVAVLLPQRKLINRFINMVCELEEAPEPAYERDFRQEIDYDTVNDHLTEHDIKLRYLGSDFGQLTESDEMPLVYLMTYHSAKGLDYDTVFLPHLDSTMQFWRNNEDISRRLFFVAATRSRRNLFMSHHSQQPHAYVRAMPENLLKKIDAKVDAKSSSDDIDIF